MEDTRITFETAKLAKEKGFKWKSKKGYLENGSLGISHYSDYCENDNEDYPTKFSAPTQSLLSKWLREKYNLYTESQMYIEEGLYKFKYVIKSDFEYNLIVLKEKYNFSTYEEAYEIGLQEALKLI